MKTIYECPNLPQRGMMLQNVYPSARGAFVYPCPPEVILPPEPSPIGPTPVPPLPSDLRIVETGQPRITQDGGLRILLE
jgi:hypothetical protein